MKNTTVIIHGHFYQPPRENPWLDIIEHQPYAAPYHDYNHKISEECYTPNGFSRYLDNRGRVLDIVNNYEFLSYNFGPTLLSWMQGERPHTLQKIIEGDKAGRKRFGRGGAMAQAYNHVIMPLASQRDRLTQIRWGIADFKHRFNRMPEGMWMPETAINQATVDDLVSCHIKFTILAPTQAEKIRLYSTSPSPKPEIDKAGAPEQADGQTPLRGTGQADGEVRPQSPEQASGYGDWIDVSAGNIDTSRSYRCYNSARTGWLDIIFYDAPLSTAVSFEHLLRDAEGFISRLKEAATGRNMICIATDGEIYGHHEPFANMCITAMAVKLQQESHGLNMNNAAAWLAANASKHEVVLKAGENREGTAWSCSHSLGRWKKDCGCSTDSPPEWNQAWRQPLRQGLEELGEQLNDIYEKESAAYFHSPWEARDDYVHYILEPGEKNFDLFLERHGSGTIHAPAEKSRALMLLEMQKYAMYMFTSCGWFFGELSRLEPVQNLKYACRAIQLADLFGKGQTIDNMPVGRGLEKNLLAFLKKAPSNIPEIGDGVNVWKQHVLSAAVPPEKFIHYHAVASLLTDSSPESLYGYRFNTRTIEKSGNSLCAHLQLVHKLTMHQKEYLAYCSQSQGEKLYTRVLPHPDPAVVEAAMNAIKKGESPEFEGMELELADLFQDKRHSLLSRMFAFRLADIRESYRKIYEENITLIDTIAEMGMRLPQELAVPATQTLSLDLRDKVDFYLQTVLSESPEAASEASEPGIIQHIDDILGRATSLSLDMKTPELREHVALALYSTLDTIIGSMSAEAFKKADKILALVEKINLNFDDGALQDQVYAAVHALVQKKKNLIKSNRLEEMNFGTAARILKLARRLNFNTDWMKRELSPFEEED